MVNLPIWVYVLTFNLLNWFLLKKRLKKLKKTVYEEPDELKRAPHSFVIHRGQIGKSLLQLVKDFRKVMEPFTASSLQVT